MSITPHDFEFMRELILARSAIVLEPGKEYLLQARLEPVARELGLAGIHGVVEALRRAPSGPLVTRVVDAMTTNETSFFRDTHPFEMFRDRVVPDLMRSNADRRAITIWSAACSTGQEPYSLAMTLHDHFPQLASWDVKIIATDLSETVLAHARKGLYRQLEINRGLPPRLLSKYFRSEGGTHTVVPEIKRFVHFRELNLIGPWFNLPRFDVVFIRNVLIYFDVPTKKAILTRIRQHMYPRARLFLGSAETTHAIDENFERESMNHAQCYRLKVDV